MSERFLRCAHCGLPHDAGLKICPSTGLRIDRSRRARRKGGANHVPTAPQRSFGKRVGWEIDGKYRVIAAIGEGGMSSIYEAEQLRGGPRVAIKVLHPSLADDPEAIARLMNEAKVVAAIGHANICEVYEVGRTSEGAPYLVMERLVGETLAERIERAGRMRYVELAPILQQILGALGAAHRRSIVHRDLKPENIFLVGKLDTPRPVAKLLDFGISKSIGDDFGESQRLTHTGMVMGTPYYMAPEQARGDSALDGRVDLWAAGVIMYQALTARRPFVATNYNALLVKILTSRPRPLSKLIPNVSPSVEAVVSRAMSKLREDRFQTSDEFLAALAEVQGPPPPPVYDDLQDPTVVMDRPQVGAGMVVQRTGPGMLRIETTPSPPPVQAPVAAAANAAAALPDWDDDIPPEPLEPTIIDRVDLDGPEDPFEIYGQPSSGVPPHANLPTQPGVGQSPVEPIDMEAEDTERMRRRPAHMPAGPPPQEPHIEEDPTALSAGVKRPPRYPRSDASRDEDTATEVVIRNKPEGD